MYEPAASWTTHGTWQLKLATMDCGEMDSKIPRLLVMRGIDASQNFAPSDATFAESVKSL